MSEAKSDSRHPDTKQLDIESLGKYLGQVIPDFGTLASAEKFPDGQSNPTFHLKASGGEFVLRRKPPGELLASAHAVDREYRVLAALAETDVPVARVYHLCEDDDVIGSMFFVMEFVDGRIFWTPSLPEVATNEERGQIYDEMNRVLAAIHTVDLEAVGLGDFGKPGSYYERQFARWSKQYRASETRDIPVLEELIAWLDANMVVDDGKVSLVHGDYRLDNTIFAHDKAKMLAVNDWELSTLGHPFADLAYQCMVRYFPGGPAFRGLGDSDIKALGIPEEQDYIDRYCERTSLSGIDNWHFYLAFGMFRLAAIAQGVYKRGLDGNASSERALQLGEMVEPLAETAMKKINSA